MSQAGVMIHTMHLAGDTRQRDAFLHSLDNQHWMGENEQRIIFIRKISVSGYWWELAQKISQESNDQVAKIINYKNDNDQLVVFGNYAHLAAQVITDLLAGNKPWYLIRWLEQESLKADPVSVLQHKIYDLPAILENLYKSNQLTALFSRIDIASLQMLLSSLAVISPVLLSNKLDFVIGSEVNSSSVLLSKSTREWINHYLVHLLPSSLPEQNLLSIVRLVSGLSAWKFSPQLLKDVDGFCEWHFAVVRVYREAFHPTLTLPSATAPALPYLPASMQSLARGGDGSHPVASRGSSPSPLPRGRLGGGEISEEKFLIHQAGLFFLLNLLKNEKAPLSLTLPHEGGGDRFDSVSNRESNSSSSTTAPALSYFPASMQSVARGGDRFDSASSGESSPSPLPRGRLGGGENFKTINPWIIIYQLFQKISKEFSFSLEPVLFDLLIEISHLTDEEFHEGLLVENPVIEQWFLHINEKLQKMNLWNADWFQSIARVEVDQAYVHFYMDNSAIKLDLRLAGLDVNPGWVPWLGRVINFHYGNYPELAMN